MDIPRTCHHTTITTLLARLSNGQHISATQFYTAVYALNGEYDGVRRAVHMHATEMCTYYGTAIIGHTDSTTDSIRTDSSSLVVCYHTCFIEYVSFITTVSRLCLLINNRAYDTYGSCMHVWYRHVVQRIEKEVGDLGRMVCDSMDIRADSTGHTDNTDNTDNTDSTNSTSNAMSMSILHALQMVTVNSTDYYTHSYERHLFARLTMHYRRMTSTPASVARMIIAEMHARDRYMLPQSYGRHSGMLVEYFVLPYRHVFVDECVRYNGIVCMVTGVTGHMRMRKRKGNKGNRQGSSKRSSKRSKKKESKKKGSSKGNKKKGNSMVSNKGKKKGSSNVDIQTGNIQTGSIQTNSMTDKTDMPMHVHVHRHRHSSTGIAISNLPGSTTIHTSVPDMPIHTDIHAVQAVIDVINVLRTLRHPIANDILRQALHMHLLSMPVSMRTLCRVHRLARYYSKEMARIVYEWRDAVVRMECNVVSMVEYVDRTARRWYMRNGRTSNGCMNNGCMSNGCRHRHRHSDRHSDKHKHSDRHSSTGTGSRNRHNDGSTGNDKYRHSDKHRHSDKYRHSDKHRHSIGSTGGCILNGACPHIVQTGKIGSTTNQYTANQYIHKQYTANTYSQYINRQYVRLLPYTDTAMYICQYEKCLMARLLSHGHAHDIGNALVMEEHILSTISAHVDGLARRCTKMISDVRRSIRLTNEYVMSNKHVLTSTIYAITDNDNHNDNHSNTVSNNYSTNSIDSNNYSNHIDNSSTDSTSSSGGTGLFIFILTNKVWPISTPDQYMPMHDVPALLASIDQYYRQTCTYHRLAYDHELSRMDISVDGRKMRVNVLMYDVIRSGSGHVSGSNRVAVDVLAMAGVLSVHGDCYCYAGHTTGGTYRRCYVSNTDIEDMTVHYQHRHRESVVHDRASSAESVMLCRICRLLKRNKEMSADELEKVCGRNVDKEMRMAVDKGIAVCSDGKYVYVP